MKKALDWGRAKKKKPSENNVIPFDLWQHWRRGMLVSYKGRRYRLAWYGSTEKYGLRAKLQFTDGSTEFWVDAEMIRPA